MSVMTIYSFFTPADAAAALGISERLVRAYCRSGRLRAEHVGRFWLIEKRSLQDFKKTPRPRGNPNFKKST